MPPRVCDWDVQTPQLQVALKCPTLRPSPGCVRGFGRSDGICRKTESPTTPPRRFARRKADGIRGHCEKQPTPREESGRSQDRVANW